MTLFNFIKNGFELDANYRCSLNTTPPILERPILGWYFLTSGIFFIVLYIPCFVVMYQSKSRPPAFHIMMVLAVSDMFSLVMNSVLTGILDILGMSYCHAPHFIFIVGAVGGGSWMGGSLACILLAIERCVETQPNFFLKFFFYKRVFRLVVFTLLLYWMYAILLTKPILFTAQFSSWFFDPGVGMEADLYVDMPHIINNLVVAAGTTFFYIYLCIYLLVKNNNSSTMWVVRSKQQIILQSIILCSFHVIAAYIYTYMQFFYSPPAFIVFGQIAWQLSNGCFCVVYLTSNRTIRNSVLSMLFTKKFGEVFGLYVQNEEPNGAVGVAEIVQSIAGVSRGHQNAVAAWPAN